MAQSAVRQLCCGAEGACGRKTNEFDKVAQLHLFKYRYKYKHKYRHKYKHKLYNYQNYKLHLHLIGGHGQNAKDWVVTECAKIVMYKTTKRVHCTEINCFKINSQS